MSMSETIQRKLTEELDPRSVKVIDESHHHAGHAGAPAGGESHFRIEIISETFKHLDRISRQRLVYQILNHELSGSVHALALTTMTPDEAMVKAHEKNEHEVENAG